MKLLFSSLLLSNTLIGSTLAATTVDQLGQSGKFRIRDDSFPGASDPNAVTIEADYVYEFPYGSGEGTWTMANQDFSMSGAVATTLPGVEAGAEVSASLVSFATVLTRPSGGASYGTFEMDTYVFEESGTVQGSGGESFEVEANDVKFNLLLSDWEFASDDVEFVDVGVIVKGRGGKRDPQQTGNNRFDLGGSVPLILSGTLTVDGEEQSMESGYPKVNQTGNKYTFVFRFPRFDSDTIYDPVVEYSKAEKTSDGDDSGGSPACFSKDATVQVLGQTEPVKMEQLQVGDKVLVQDNAYETVYAFGHLEEQTKAEFLQIYTQGNKKALEMTGNHLIYKQGKTVRADSLKIGDQLSSGRTISKINTIEKQGLYMPLVTGDGSLLVNDVLVSSYVSIAQEAPKAVEVSQMYFGTSQEHVLLHWWLAPYRMMCLGVSDKLCQHQQGQEGILNWLTVGQRMAEWANHNIQSTLVQSVLLGLPMFVVFGLLVTVEWFFGSAFAPTAIAFTGAALVYQYRRRTVGGGDMVAHKKMA